MTFWVRFLEISGNFHHRRSLFMTSFHYIFTTLPPHFHHIYTTIYTTWNVHDIFSLHFQYKFSPRRDEQTGMNRLQGAHRQIFNTYLHHKFTLHIFTTPVVKIQIFTPFSRHGLDLIFSTRSENSDFHDIFTRFSWHGLDLIFPHQYFTRIFTFSRHGLDLIFFHQYFTQIFTTFSRHGRDLIFFHQYFTRIFTTIGILATFGGLTNRNIVPTHSHYHTLWYPAE